MLTRLGRAGAAARLLQGVAAPALPDHLGCHAGRVLGAPVSARADCSMIPLTCPMQAACLCHGAVVVLPSHGSWALR